MKIDKGIPYPVNIYPRKKDEFYYLAEKMEIGDSVFFENNKDAQKLKSRIEMRIRDFREQYPSQYQIIRTMENGVNSKFMVNVYWGVVKKVDGGWRCWFVDGLKVAKEKYGETND